MSIARPKDMLLLGKRKFLCIYTPKSSYLQRKIQEFIDSIQENRMNIKDLQEAYPLELGVDNPLLRTPCQPITEIDDDIRGFGLALQKLLWAYEGVGLAAPQVGRGIRMAAITQRDMSKKKWDLELEDVMINPIILGQADSMLIDQEACLSLPGMKGDVPRPASITVKYTRLDGSEHILKADDYNARIILHEMDHLDGVLFVDRMM